MQSWPSKMRAFQLLRTLSTRPTTQKSEFVAPFSLYRFYSAQQETHHHSEDSDSDATFDSSHFDLPPTNVSSNNVGRNVIQQPTWDVKFREKAKAVIFNEVIEEEDTRRKMEKNAQLAKILMKTALSSEDEDEEEREVVKEEDQVSLSVGIIGAPNAGKSALTNYMVGTKVAAVSRKTNTTTHEVLGVMTKGNTQICFFDTPGLMLRKNGFPHKDMKARVESAWSVVDIYDVLIVIFDVDRHINKMDNRVRRLIKHIGAEMHPTQKRILCMNKVDLVKKKKDLLTVAEEFKDLPGYEKFFMISGLKGSGVKDLTTYLMNQAVKRPWEEDPQIMTEEVMKNISLEVVRERLLDHVHQEVPYELDHHLIDWKELRDGSLRIEQHLLTSKESQRKILVGKKGCKIGRIGIEANEELRKIFKRNVHLILQMRLEKLEHEESFPSSASAC